MTNMTAQEALDGWNALEADCNSQKEKILLEHFEKAAERLEEGVSLTNIRKFYEKLGAKYSPVTFRKKWNELLKEHHKI